MIFALRNCIYSSSSAQQFASKLKMKLFPQAAFVAISMNGIAALSTTTPPMPPLSSMAEHLPLARRAMDFIDHSPDPFHCVQTSIERLSSAGFVELQQDQPYKGKLQAGGKYYFTKNKSALVAFAVGGKYHPGNGFKIIGSHSDSPNLKIKPRSKRTSSVAGYHQIGVECYGGGLWHTWFDRDLGVSGRVLIQEDNGMISQKLVKIDRPILRIPNLAIHMQTAKERDAFEINKEDHLAPIISYEAAKALTGDKNGSDGDGLDGWKSNQNSLLLDAIASEMDIDVDKIVDFELNLYDTQRAAFGGAKSEFIHSARLDNLASCFMSLESLLQHVKSDLQDDEGIPLIVMFDHEEVGSVSSVGAGSPIISEAVQRISSAFGEEGNSDLLSLALRKSFVLSSDQAHAIHPNYSSKHEKAHSPKMNHGMVIKTNSSQRYATNGISGFIIREIARRAGLPPVQEFVVRQDCACGSTIGPIISATTGIRAVDMGCPQLSMHSIRETMGTADLSNGIDLFKAYFKLFRDVDSSIMN
mmetsp:Transcript_20100/g.28592  ORF Transcript_20100/g.28592 Transcript_20100/m.28592 type:complete len:528 (-) Transcript_20100:1206-2789(-)